MTARNASAKHPMPYIQPTRTRQEVLQETFMCGPVAWEQLLERVWFRHCSKGCRPRYRQNPSCDNQR